MGVLEPAVILPIGDAPNPKGYRPWVTWALMLANVGAYLIWTLPLGRQPVDPTAPAFVEYAAWMQGQVPGLTLEDLASFLTRYDLFVFAHGYQPGRPALGDLLGSLFLHSGALHLAGNLLFLWIYGDNVEHRLGRLPFLGAYLGAGVAATWVHGAAAGASLTPLVGASGAISGLLGFYFVFFPKNHVRLVVLLPFLLWKPFLIPARLVLSAYIVLDNLIPILFQDGDNVAHGAHLGGFVAGAVCALAVEALARRLPAGSRSAPAGSWEAVRQGEAGPALAALRDAPRSASRRCRQQNACSWLPGWTVGRRDRPSLRGRSPEEGRARHGLPCWWAGCGWPLGSQRPPTRGFSRQPGRQTTQTSRRRRRPRFSALLAKQASRCQAAPASPCRPARSGCGIRWEGEAGGASGEGPPAAR